MNESISPYYQDARSDKEYPLQLQAQDAWSAFTGTALEERFSGVVPQLLNVVDEQQAQALLDDPGWVAQEKYNGHRRLARRTVEELTGINRKGLVTGLPQEVARELLELEELLGEFTVDGELVDATYYIFDLLEMHGIDQRALDTLERLALLEPVAQQIVQKGLDSLVVVRTAVTAADKRALYDDVRAGGREGVVFKRRTAAYVPGRPNSGGDQLKRRFTHSASLLVASRNPTKRSVALELLDADYRKVAVGNVTIPSNHDIPGVGSVVEVEYLYAFDDGSLFQPQYKGLRDDLDAAVACTLGQLHLKPSATHGAEG